MSNGADAPTGDDLIKALRLFDGKLVVRRSRKGNYRDPAEGQFGISFELSDEEVRESRTAVHRLLKSRPVPDQLIGRLAAAFGEGEEAGPVKVEIKFRGRNTPNDELHAAQMILEIVNEHAQHPDRSYADARHEVEAKHGYAVDGLKSLWERPRWRPLRNAITQALGVQK